LNTTEEVNAFVRKEMVRGFSDSFKADGTMIY
jgi:hypothetical protein